MSDLVGDDAGQVVTTGRRRIADDQVLVALISTSAPRIPPVMVSNVTVVSPSVLSEELYGQASSWKKMTF
jgi:hypothetical protein